MRTNIEIDDQLMADTMKALGVRTKREAIDRALRTTLQLQRQEAIMGLWGLGWDGDLEAMRVDKPLEEYG